MKKIILASVLFFTTLGFANAQQAPAKTTEKKHVKATTTTTVQDANKKDAKATTSVTSATDKKAVKTNTTGIKKDGTPDMRMKQNKVSAKTTTTTKVKKDGTPDMRYKDNKKK